MQKCANQYHFDSHQAELILKYQPIQLFSDYSLSAELGAIYSIREVTGSGDLKNICLMLKVIPCFFYTGKI